MKKSIETKICMRALASRVLAVAVKGNAGDWCAYIDAVPGKNHDDEWYEVRLYGAKLSKRIAEILFPEFVESKLIWRR